MEKFLGATTPNIASGLSGMVESYGNKQSATSLASKLGLSGDDAKSFIDIFKNLPSQDQLGGVQKLAEAQANLGYLQTLKGDVPTEPSAQDSPSSTFTPSGGKIKMGDFMVDHNELPKKSVPPPATQMFKDARKIYEDQAKENRAEIKKYSENYEDLSKLQSRLHKIEEAEKIIKNGNFDAGFIQAATRAALEGQHQSELGQLLASDDQKKVYSLLYEFIQPKEFGGTNPSTREALLSMQRLPSYLSGKAASEYTINQLKKEAERQFKKGKLISSLRKYDPNMDPSQFKDFVENKMINEMPGKVSMIRPDGQEGLVDANRVEEAISKGFRKA